MVLPSSGVVNGLMQAPIAVGMANVSEKATSFMKWMFIGIGTHLPEIIVRLDQAENYDS